MLPSRTLNIWTDGGSRGNPGPAAIGICMTDNNGKEIFRLGKQIGACTNNVAEYTAVIFALQWLIENKNIMASHYNFYLDSSLVVNQLNGLFKIKNYKLKKMIIQIKELEEKIPGKIFYQYIPREKNKVADSLLNNSF